MTTTQYPEDMASVGMLELEYVSEGQVRVTVRKLNQEPLATATFASVYLPTAPGQRSAVMLMARPVLMISTLGLM